MRPNVNVAMLAAIALLCAGVSLAEETLRSFGDQNGRSFHEDLYSEPACLSCHEENRQSKFPADDVCLNCHDLESVVSATEREGDEKWQNPHNNLHYGKEVPCMECHGEHEARKPLCKGCHSFKYPNHRL